MADRGSDVTGLAAPPFVTAAGRVLHLPPLGFGAAPIGNMGRSLTDAEAVATIEQAFDQGLAYVDVAPLYGYGLAERRVGMALAGRDDVTLSTKVGRVLDPCADGTQDGGIYVEVPPLAVRFDYSRDGVLRAYENSVDRLGRTPDILFVHDIDVLTHGSEQASTARISELVEQGGWQALQELRDRGDVSAIGAGVNDVQSCLRLLDLVDPDLFLLAGRYTLLDQQALDTLLPRCAQRNVGVVIGGPYNSGILATGPIPGAWYDYAPAVEPVLERTRAIQRICDAHNVPLAAAALQFPLLHPAVISVIAGARTPAETFRNAQMIAIDIPPGLWRDLRAVGLLHPEAPC